MCVWSTGQLVNKHTQQNFVLYALGSFSATLMTMGRKRGHLHACAVIGSGFVAFFSTVLLRSLVQGSVCFPSARRCTPMGSCRPGLRNVARVVTHIRGKRKIGGTTAKCKRSDPRFTCALFALTSVKKGKKRGRQLTMPGVFPASSFLG